MEVPVDFAPVHTSFRELASAAGGLARYDSEYAFTGQLPLEANMQGMVDAAGLFRYTEEVPTAIVETWYTAWRQQREEVERIRASQSADGSQLEVLIAGPSAVRGETASYPAVSFTMEFTESGVLTGVYAGLGFVDKNDQPKAAEWVDRYISQDELQLLQDGYPEGIVNYDQVLGYALLADCATYVTTTAQDPLRIPSQQLYAEIMQDPESAAMLQWSRSRFSGGHDAAAELCCVRVDPERFGENRYVVFMRKSTNPDAVLSFTDMEWRAFTQGGEEFEFFKD